MYYVILRHNIEQNCIAHLHRVDLLLFLLLNQAQILCPYHHTSFMHEKCTKFVAHTFHVIRLELA